MPVTAGKNTAKTSQKSFGLDVRISGYRGEWVDGSQGLTPVPRAVRVTLWTETTAVQPDLVMALPAGGSR